MKNNPKDRLVEMLDKDKAEMNEASKAAAVADFMRVAGEYFETEGEPRFTVERTKGGYQVNLTFRAVRVKNFSTLQ